LSMHNLSGIMLFPGHPVNQGGPYSKHLTSFVSIWNLEVVAPHGTWRIALRHMATSVSQRVG